MPILQWILGVTANTLKLQIFWPILKYSVKVKSKTNNCRLQEDGGGVGGGGGAHVLIYLFTSSSLCIFYGTK